MAEFLSKAEFPFVGGSYEAQSRTFDGAKTVNMYPEMHDYGAGKNMQPAYLKSRCGLKPVQPQEIGLGPHRGAYTTSNSEISYIVSGNEVYQLSSPSGTPIAITGNLTTSSGPVSMVDNGATLLIVDGQNGYTIDLNTTVLNLIVDDHFYNGAKTCTYLNGYFICEIPGTSLYFFSNPDEATWPALNTASADSNPDTIVSVFANNQQLYVIGTKSIEVWSGSGASASEPFSPIPGQSINIGCVAPFTIQRLANMFLFLSSNDQGDGIVYMMENDMPVRVSTHAIENQIQNLGSLVNSTAVSWQENGHLLYALNVSSTNTTLVYDLTSKQWVNFESRDEFGVQSRWFGQTHCMLQGQHIIGDYRNGTIYTLSTTYFKDGLNSMPRTRRCPHAAKGMQMYFYSVLELDLQPGAGTLTTNPRYVLRISYDGGFTWGNAIYASGGKIGQYKQRCRWQRLGRARDPVFEISCDENVDVVMLGAYLAAEQGTS